MHDLNQTLERMHLSPDFQGLNSVRNLLIRMTKFGRGGGHKYVFCHRATKIHSF